MTLVWVDVTVTDTKVECCLFQIWLEEQSFNIDSHILWEVVINLKIDAVRH